MAWGIGRKLKKLGKKVEKEVKRSAGKVGGVLGGVVGTALGAPALGATLGSSLGKGLVNDKKKSGSSGSSHLDDIPNVGTGSGVVGVVHNEGYGYLTANGEGVITNSLRDDMRSAGSYKINKTTGTTTYVPGIGKNNKTMYLVGGGIILAVLGLIFLTQNKNKRRR